ncbi:MAG: ABC transporter substrate-binding protein [Actinobacteria bacterium]|nr:ABC transporter substrate-binding protein [Actinomycetota bacterium]
MRKRSFVVGSASLVALMALAACGGGSSAGTPASGTGSAAAPANQTLVVDTTFNLKTVDPGRMFETTGLLIDRALYSTLLTFTGGDVKKPVPDLAESYTASPDGTTYTFKLRSDAVFSDGTPVTSADVVFSLNRVKAIAGNPSFLMAGITVTAPDASTVVLTSEKPNPSIPFIVPNPALGILNSTAVKASGGTDAEGADKNDKAETALNTASQGSGPYTLSSFSTTTQVVLEANAKYWGTKPAYSKVVLRNVAANVQKLNVTKGESQIALDLSPTQAEGMKDVQVVNGASPNVFFLFTNNDPKISATTANKDFQEAVRYGIDYDGLVALAGTGSTQAAGVIPTMFLGSLPAGSGVKRDVARAKAALARSGISNPTVDIGYPSDFASNGIAFGDLAARVQANLKEVGITVNLKGSSVQTALAEYRDGKEQMGLWFWGPDYPDPGDYLVFLPDQLVGKRAGYVKGANPALEALGEKAATTVDDAERVKLYEQIQTELNTSSPFMPLLQPAQIVVAGQSVKNVQSNAVWLATLSELG